MYSITHLALLLLVRPLELALEVGEVSISAGGKMVNSGGEGESADDVLFGPEKTERESNT